MTSVENLNERICQRVELENGRFLSYAEYGPPNGTPIFYFHGFPSSRLDWQIFNDENTLQKRSNFCGATCCQHHPQLSGNLF
jgi:hypothetical protein